MNCRWVLPFFSVIFFGIEAFASDLKQGSSAITTATVQVIVGGKPSGSVEAGQTVTILGLQAASGQAVISYQPANGPKLVGLAPLDKLVAVDAGASNTTTTTFVPAAPPVDLTQILDALVIGQHFKADKFAAKTKFEGQRVKFKGIIDRLDLDRANGEDMPVLYIKTAPSLPRLKVRLSNSLGGNDAFFRRYSSYIPQWWWGYRERSIDFRMSGLNEIQVRMVYRYSSTTRWSDGTSSTSRSRSSSNWFTIFKVGEPVSIEATCKGLYMDVDFDNGILLN